MPNTASRQTGHWSGFQSLPLLSAICWKPECQHHYFMRLQRLKIALFAAPLAFLACAADLHAGANMRRDGAITLNQPTNDTHGFYAAAIDPVNGFAYFASRFAYKVNIATPLPTQVGSAVNLAGTQSYSAAMDSTAGCVYFGSGGSICQILANGTNAPSAGATMSGLFGSAFVTQVLMDASDPANHYLYAMTETGLTNSTLYKIALNNFPNSASIIGSATTTTQQPALGYGVIDLTNHCAYYGNFVATSQQLYLVKFALGAGSNAPANVGGIVLDSETNRGCGNLVLDIANGYGYSDSDDTDINFGHGRVYKWALNGTNVPSLVSYVDMHTNEGFCHVAVIKPAQGLLYFSSDLSYPAYIYRYRLPAGTNAPVETGNIPLLTSPDTNVPAWGYNPTNSTNWGEVFARSMVYDPVHDFAYIGRDYADAQLQPFTDQIVKVALDRDEMVVSLTTDVSNTNNSIPFNESFESYSNGFGLVGTNGWFAEDSAMAIVTTNNFTNTYTGTFPILGPDQYVLQVAGAVTNRFSPSSYTNIWADMIVQAQYWTDPLMLSPSNTPFAFCVATNGHLAVWNCTNISAASNGWTELLDTFISSSNEYARVTIEAAYNRDANNEFYYRVWVNGIASTNPQTWYAAADTNQNYFGDIVAQGNFALDDFVVTGVNPFAPPSVVVSAIARNPDGSITLQFSGVPNMTHRVLAASSLTPPVVWSPISTNVAGAYGAWQFTDTNISGVPLRFYRASLP
jgi:hypothetical protein